MPTFSDIIHNSIVQATVISALSHVLVWAAGHLPGGYSAAKRAVAIKLISWAKSVSDAPPAAVPAAVDEAARIAGKTAAALSNKKSY